jgi:hypothetical protein
MLRPSKLGAFSNSSIYIQTFLNYYVDKVLNSKTTQFENYETKGVITNSKQIKK